MKNPYRFWPTFMLKVMLESRRARALDLKNTHDAWKRRFPLLLDSRGEWLDGFSLARIRGEGWGDYRDSASMARVRIIWSESAKRFARVESAELEYKMVLGEIKYREGAL